MTHFKYLKTFESFDSTQKPITEMGQHGIDSFGKSALNQAITSGQDIAYCSKCDSHYYDRTNPKGGHYSTRELKITKDGKHICPTCETDEYLKDISSDDE